MKKLTSILLAVLMLIVSACAAEESPAALTYGETVVTEAMYTYYVSTYKGRYIQSYSDISDTAEFWESDMGGRTGEEVIGELIYGNVAQILVAAEEFRREGLSLTAEQTEAVDERIESMIDELAEGSRKTMNGHLSEFGVNIDMLRDMLLLETEAQAYRDHLYGEGGTDEIDDSDREEYFSENYVRFQQIFINDVRMYETDKDGAYLTDENGQYQTRELTAEEREEVEGRIAAVESGLDAGEDFDSLKEKYSDSKDYERGYYFSAASSTNYITAVVSAAFSLEEGEWARVQGTDDTGVFFIKRLPLEEGAYKDEELSDFFEDFDENLKTERYGEKLEALFGEIVKNEEYLGAVSVADAPANYYYY